MGVLLSWNLPKYFEWCHGLKIPLSKAGEFWQKIGVINESYIGLPTVLLIVLGIYLIQRIVNEQYRLYSYVLFGNLLFGICFSVILAIFIIPPAFIVGTLYVH